MVGVGVGSEGIVIVGVGILVGVGIVIPPSPHDATRKTAVSTATTPEVRRTTTRRALTRCPSPRDFPSQQPWPPRGQWTRRDI